MPGQGWGAAAFGGDGEPWPLAKEKLGETCQPQSPGLMPGQGWGTAAFGGDGEPWPLAKEKLGETCQPESPGLMPGQGWGTAAFVFGCAFLYLNPLQVGARM